MKKGPPQGEKINIVLPEEGEKVVTKTNPDKVNEWLKNNTSPIEGDSALLTTKAINDKRTEVQDSYPLEPLNKLKDPDQPFTGLIVKTKEEKGFVSGVKKFLRIKKK